MGVSISRAVQCKEGGGFNQQHNSATHAKEMVQIMGNGVVAENNSLSMAVDARKNPNMGEPKKRRHDRTIEMCNVL